MTDVSNQEAIPELDAVLTNDGKRLWGKFSAMGTAYGKTIANFRPGNGGNYHTVEVPENLKEYVLTALVNRLTVLARFEPEFKPFAKIVDMSIHN